MTGATIPALLNPPNMTFCMTILGGMVFLHINTYKTWPASWVHTILTGYTGIVYIFIIIREVV